MFQWYMSTAHWSFSQTMFHKIAVMTLGNFNNTLPTNALPSRRHSFSLSPAIYTDLLTLYIHYTVINQSDWAPVTSKKIFKGLAKPFTLLPVPDFPANSFYITPTLFLTLILTPTLAFSNTPRRHGVTESRDVDSHVSGTPQVGSGSHDQVTPLQLYTAAPSLEARGCLA